MDYLSFEKSPLRGILAVYTQELIYYPAKKNGNITNGELLTLETAKSLFSTLFTNDLIKNDLSFEDLIPYNVLDYSKEEKYVIWYTEPSSRKLYFSENLNIASGNYPMPYLLWKISGTKLNVWALKEKPISKNTDLYLAPLLNINAKGDVCMGNVNFVTNKTNYEAIISKVQEGFFNSYFTHTNHNELIKGNIIDLYKDILDKSTYNWNNILVKTNKKIKDILL